MSNRNIIGSVVAYGLPDIPLTRGRPTNGFSFFQQGQRDVKRLLKAGRGFHVKTTVPHAKGAMSLMAGARQLSKELGFKVTVARRPQEDGTVDVYVCFRDDVTQRNAVNESLESQKPLK